MDSVQRMTENGSLGENISIIYNDLHVVVFLYTHF